MIFVTLGTQKFQFNRLLKMIDELIDEEVITDCVYAQLGNSDYSPKKFESVQFLDANNFTNTLENADLIITHSGVGTILKAVKAGKKVIVIPRLAEFGEHVDNHQVEIAKSFYELGYVLQGNSKSDLEECIKKIQEFVPKTYIENNKYFVEKIKQLLDKT